MAASLSDSALFMDMDLFKEEEDASLTAAGAMDFPASSLELVQLLACDDDFLGAHTAADVFDGSYNADDLSDGVTDDASSDMASPPPTFGEDDRTSAPSSPAVCRFVPTAQTSGGGGGGGATVSMQQPLAVKLKLPAPVSPPAAPVCPAATVHRATAPLSLVPSSTTVPSAVPAATMLPFAFPVACFPPLNANLKRPLADVLPNQPAASLDPIELKKSKRALRQMKNRESANRSRLRRKEQLSDLSVEVDELTKKQHELQNTIAALRAENKSLQDQNSFLRSLVTMYSDPARTAALPPMPAPVATPSTSRPQLAPTTQMSMASHHDLESGHKSPTDSLMEESCDEEDEEMDVLVLPTPKKQRKSLSRSAATVSAASLGLCASVFGLTILTDSDNGAAQSSYIRRPGRVLHSLPSTTADQGCSPSLVASMVERAWELGSSSWAFLTTSDLAYGVFLNVLSFVVIMALYHCFQQYMLSKSRASKRSFRWQNLGASGPAHRRGASPASSSAAAAAAQAKRRSVSWQDVRVEAQQQHAAGDAADTSTRVQVFK